MKNTKLIPYKKKLFEAKIGDVLLTATGNNIVVVVDIKTTAIHHHVRKLQYIAIGEDGSHDRYDVSSIFWTQELGEGELFRDRTFYRAEMIK